MTQLMQAHRAPPDSLPPGTPLLQGQFLIESFLNAGGFGITYLARNSLERRVVLKECYPSTMCCRSRSLVRARSRSHQTEFDVVVRLFGEEARRLAKLDHKNIVGVHDVFEDNGTAYMALDYVEGRDLFDVIETDPVRLGPDEIVTLTRKLLEAIAHVHALDILHRDISPDNVLLDRNNEPVLIDFGAARDTARRASRVLSALQVVKDGYSPQEFYIAGAAQNPAGDLYSLAATIYHLLTGAPPVYSHMRLAALAEQKEDPFEPVSGRVQGYDPHFLAAIDQALSVFAKDRPQSAREWIEFIDVEARQRALAAKVTADPDVTDRIRQLVEDTNAAVKVEQERAAREAAEQKRRDAEAIREKDAARQRLRERAIREAEEAERDLREAELAERRRAAAEAAEKVRKQAEEAARIAAEIAAAEQEQLPAGKRKRGKTKRPVADARRPAANPDQVEPQQACAPARSERGWFRRLLGGQRKQDAAKSNSQMEGYRA